VARFAQRTRSLGVPAAGTGTRSWAVTVVTVCPPPAVGELRTDAAGVEAADSARVVKRLCEVLQIARSSFYAWLDGEPRRAERAAADAELTERIRVVHERDPTQGGPRITAELNDGAPPVAPVNHKRVARVMREHGITGLRLRRRVRITVPEPADQKVPDLLTATSPPTRRTSATSAISPHG
jgi:transposase InsO family protein